MSNPLAKYGLPNARFVIGSKAILDFCNEKPQEEDS